MLTCSLDPAASGGVFQWTGTSGTLVSNGALLQVLAVTSALNGTVYTCTASLGNMNISRAATVTVTGKAMTIKY